MKDLQGSVLHELQEYGMPGLSFLAGILYQRDGMSEEYETEHARVKALADLLDGFGSQMLQHLAKLSELTHRLVI